MPTHLLRSSSLDASPPSTALPVLYTAELDPFGERVWIALLEKVSEKVTCSLLPLSSKHILTNSNTPDACLLAFYPFLYSPHLS